MPTRVVPSALKPVREALLAQAPITSSAIGTDVHYSIPASATYPIIVLSIVDEIENRAGENNDARVQVDIWGTASNSDAVLAVYDLATIVQSVARDLAGDWPSGKIRNCRAPSRLPSPDPAGRARVIVDIECEIYPA